MAVLTRIVAVAAIASTLLTSVVAQSPAEVYDNAALRARRHHERARDISLNSNGEIKKRAAAKRCAAATTTTSKAATTSVVHTSTIEKPATTSQPATTHKASTTTTKKAATTTSSKAVTTTKASSGGGGKKGLAWSGSNDQLAQYLVNGNIGWLYTWGATPPTASGVMSCSMLWGTGSKLTQFQAARSKYDCLMGPNEFNLDSQSGLSVAEVYKLWSQEVLPYGSGKYLMSPSVTTAPSGLTDMQELIKMCDNGDCGWDCVSMHYYGTDSGDLATWITNQRAGLGYPNVCLTEYSCQDFANNADCSASEAEAFLKGVTQWAESTSWVVKYAPYGFSEDMGNVNPVNALMSTSGKINSLGSWFINN